jgi:trimeric autotransporter adhesin
LQLPTAVAVDSSGNLYICDSANNAIRQVSNGLIVPYLGNYIQGFAGDTTGQISLNNPSDIFFDGAGNLWIADYGNGRIREFGTNGIASTVVGGGSTYTEGGFPLASALAGPHSVVVDSAGNIYIADADDNRIFKVTASTNRITTLAGTGSYGFTGDGSPANTALLNTPTSVAIDPTGNVYFVDLYNGRVRMVSPSGTLSTVAGNGSIYYSGDGAAAQNAIMSAPASVAFSSTGIYIADTGNQRVRQISLSGTISTVAGTGTGGFGGDGGAASSAELFYPGAVAVDASGFLYIADTGNQRVRKVVNGNINTVAGNGATGYSGDGGSALNATLNSPAGLAIDSAGDIYIADFGNNVVRKVSPGGAITTVAGNGYQGYSGDGGLAVSAQLSAPLGLALDSSGNLYIADSGNHVVRIVTPGGNIRTFAGNNVLGYAGDGGPALQAQLATPSGLAFDAAGNLYISDSGVNVVRMVTPAGLIVTIAGNGSAGYSGDGGPASQATFNSASGIGLDTSNDLFVADSGNNVIRLLQFVSPVPSAGAMANAASNVVGAVAPGEAATVFGSGIGPASIVNAQPDQFGNIPEQLAGTVVYFNGVPAPIVYSWAQQIGVVVPHEVTPGTALVAVQFGNQVSLELPIQVVASAPGLYTADGSGQGQAKAVNHDTGVANTAATPVPHGALITLYMTGAGDVSPSVPDGAPNNAGFAHPLLPVTATIGGVPAPVAYAGGDNGLAPGMIRVDVSVPANVSGSAVPVVVTVGNASSQPGVTIAVQ